MYARSTEREIQSHAQSSTTPPYLMLLLNVPRVWQLSHRARSCPATLPHMSVATANPFISMTSTQEIDIPAHVVWCHGVPVELCPQLMDSTSTSNTEGSYQAGTQGFKPVHFYLHTRACLSRRIDGYTDNCSQSGNVGFHQEHNEYS